MIVITDSPKKYPFVIFFQIFIPEDEANATRTLELADKLVREVPCYLLKCNVSEEAVQTSFVALTGKLYKN